MAEPSSSEIFAVTGGKAIHAPGCWQLHGVAVGPHYLTREQARAWLGEYRARHRCKICAPPIEEIAWPRLIRQARSGLGWPG